MKGLANELVDGHAFEVERAVQLHHGGQVDQGEWNAQGEDAKHRLHFRHLNGRGQRSAEDEHGATEHQPDGQKQAKALIQLLLCEVCRLAQQVDVNPPGCKALQIEKDPHTSGEEPVLIRPNNPRNQKNGD